MARVAENETLTLLQKLSDYAKKRLNEQFEKARAQGNKPNALAGAEEFIIEECDTEHLRKLLDYWLESLKKCPESEFRHGVETGLIEFDSYLTLLEEKVSIAFRD